ncbi:MAG TPA: hypothetical protein VEH29_07070, partial [Acidimicrobiales bacterium]|nr:hypothetical protein [Acidimicrobiales bacterium]
MSDKEPDPSRPAVIAPGGDEDLAFPLHYVSAGAEPDLYAESSQSGDPDLAYPPPATSTPWWSEIAVNGSSTPG